MVTLDQCGWLGPKARVVPPPPLLRDLVEHASVMDMRSVESASWLVVPDRSAHLLVHIVEDRSGACRSRASIVGPRAVGVTFPVRRRLWTVGVRFASGALVALGGPPGEEVLDRSVTLGDVWGRVGEAASSRIEAVLDPDVALDRAWDFLSRLATDVRRPGWLSAAFERALIRSASERGSGPSVRGISDALGVPPRTLRRAIVRETGLTPMRHVRIHRLYDAAYQLRDGACTVGRVASRSGYSDQAHLARDFVDLIGESPTLFRDRGRKSETCKAIGGGGAHLP
ncbi:MAG: helix-turn-helix transcriptional regulator [Gemmatimonadota bacterium]